MNKVIEKKNTGNDKQNITLDGSFLYDLIFIYSDYSLNHRFALSDLEGSHLKSLMISELYK